MHRVDEEFDAIQRAEEERKLYEMQEWQRGQQRVVRSWRDKEEDKRRTRKQAKVDAEEAFRRERRRMLKLHMGRKQEILGGNIQLPDSDPLKFSAVLPKRPKGPEREPQSGSLTERAERRTRKQPSQQQRSGAATERGGRSAAAQGGSDAAPKVEENVAAKAAKAAKKKAEAAEAARVKQEGEEAANAADSAEAEEAQEEAQAQAHALEEALEETKEEPKEAAADVAADAAGQGAE